MTLGRDFAGMPDALVAIRVSAGSCRGSPAAADVATTSAQMPTVTNFCM
jgi:hypothetical protein